MFCSLIRNFAPDDESCYGCWLSIGCSLMQFIAKCGIEYGLQFVTQFFLNPLDCLYTKKSKKSFQSYEKSRAEQKILIFFIPKRSKFAHTIEFHLSLVFLHVYFNQHIYRFTLHPTLNMAKTSLYKGLTMSVGCM